MSSIMVGNERSRTVQRLAVIAFAVSVVASAVVAANAAKPAASKATIDACALLNADQINQVTGWTVGAPERNDDGQTNIGSYSSTCMWKSANNDSGRPRFVVLNAHAWPKGNTQGPPTFLQSFRDASADGTIGRTPVPLRLGDESLWWGDGVAVRRKNVSFGVSVWDRSVPSDDRRPMEEALAKQVLQALEPV